MTAAVGQRERIVDGREDAAQSEPQRQCNTVRGETRAAVGRRQQQGDAMAGQKQSRDDGSGCTTRAAGEGWRWEEDKGGTTRS